MRKELSSLLDIRFKNKKILSQHIEFKRAKDLISEKRIDIAVKFKYVESFVENKEYDLSFYEGLYLSTIYYFSAGQYTEPGSDLKNSKFDFIKYFKDTITSIKDNGFDETKGVIPLSRNGTPLDGAHRIAIAAYYNLKVAVVYLDEDCLECDVPFFQARGASNQQLKEYLLTLVSVCDSIRVAVIWPYASIDNNLLKSLYGSQYVSMFSYDLNRNGIRNLCLLSYRNEPWIGDETNYWKGVISKADACFQDRSETRIIFYVSNGKEDDIKLKEKIRKLNDGSKHVMHSTDDQYETLVLSRILLYKYSLVILNCINRKRLGVLKKNIDEFNNHQDIHKKNIVTGSALGAVLNLRKNDDIDLLTETNQPISFKDIGSHNNYLSLYEIDNLTVVNNERCYFTFCGLRFLDIDLWLKFKRNRNEDKDKNDIRSMRKIIAGQSAYSFRQTIRDDFLLFLKKKKIYLRLKVVTFLRMIGLLNLIKSMLKK